MQWFPLSLCYSSTTLAPPASEPGPSLGTSAPPPTAPPFHREYNYTDGNVTPPIVCYQWHPSCLLTLYLTLTYILARLLVAVCVLLLTHFPAFSSWFVVVTMTFAFGLYTLPYFNRKFCFVLYIFIFVSSICFNFFPFVIYLFILFFKLDVLKVDIYTDLYQIPRF